VKLIPEKVRFPRDDVLYNIFNHVEIRDCTVLTLSEWGSLHFRYTFLTFDNAAEHRTMQPAYRVKY
jgi:hypothetical protein